MDERREKLERINHEAHHRQIPRDHPKGDAYDRRNNEKLELRLGFFYNPVFVRHSRSVLLLFISYTNTNILNQSSKTRKENRLHAVIFEHNRPSHPFLTRSGYPRSRCPSERPCTYRKLLTLQYLRP